MQESNSAQPALWSGSVHAPPESFGVRLAARLPGDVSDHAGGNQRSVALLLDAFGDQRVRRALLGLGLDPDELFKDIVGSF